MTSTFSTWKTIGYAVAIFVTGGISGGALGVYQTKSQLYAPPPQQQMAEHLITRLQARLNLTPDQVTKITPVVQNATTDIRSIRIDAAQRTNQVFERTYAQISTILTPEQNQQFQKMQEQRRELMRKRWLQNHRWQEQGNPGGFNRPGGPNGLDGPGAFGGGSRNMGEQPSAQPGQ